MITSMSQPNLDPAGDASRMPQLATQHERRSARAAGLWRQVERLVVEHPKQSLAAAALAGVVLGWIIKRRP
jgi:ElaB/YqjD/DUF883 family membrane-anchored ribosome-binding protein